MDFQWTAAIKCTIALKHIKESEIQHATGAILTNSWMFILAAYVHLQSLVQKYKYMRHT